MQMKKPGKKPPGQGPPDYQPQRCGFWVIEPKCQSYEETWGLAGLHFAFCKLEIWAGREFH